LSFIDDRRQKMRFSKVYSTIIALVVGCSVISLLGCTQKPRENGNTGNTTRVDIPNNPDIKGNPPVEPIKLAPPPELSPKTAKLPAGTEIAVIELGGMGRMEVQLFPEDAPATVANFEKMVGYGLYDGLSFNRGYVYAFIAAGNPDEKGILIYDRLETEPNKRPCKRGSLSMTRLILEDEATATQEEKSDEKDLKKAEKKPAKSAAKSKVPLIHYGEVSPTEFFIVLDDANGKFWNNDFCVFGTVITGLDTADKISEMIDWKHRSKNSKAKDIDLKNEVKIERVTIQWVGNTKPPVLGNPTTMPYYGAIPAL
jgi:cyclophilin family peptidyl-prolyl cis-trans isomerase